MFGETALPLTKVTPMMVTDAPPETVKQRLIPRQSIMVLDVLDSRVRSF